MSLSFSGAHTLCSRIVAQAVRNTWPCRSIKHPTPYAPFNMHTAGSRPRCAEDNFSPLSANAYSGIGDNEKKRKESSPQLSAEVSRSVLGSVRCHSRRYIPDQIDENTKLHSHTQAGAWAGTNKKSIGQDILVLHSTDSPVVFFFVNDVILSAAPV